MSQITENDNINNTDSLLLRSLSALSSEFQVAAPQVIPSSPQSQIFEKYINHEITEYNGLPTIEIPLYEIKTKGLIIPITLSYHASGIKYMQYDGDIGAGWSIGALGYRVTRQIKGASDFDTKINKIETRQDYNESGLYYSNDRRITDGFLLGLTIDSENPHNNAVSGVQAGVRSKITWRDGEYDRFTYNVPTSGGNFILKDRTERSVVLMDEKQDKIHIEKDNCHITDISGIEYFFGGTADDGTELIEREVMTNHETAWVLKEIKTPMNESIRFKYKKYKPQTNRNANDRYYSLTAHEAPTYHYSPALFHPDYRYLHKNEDGVKFSHSGSNPPYGYGELLFLEEIETDNILVQLKREKYFQSQYEDYNIPYMLKKIIIKDKLSNKVIKEITFNSQVLPTQVNTALGYKGTPSHLTLSSVLVDDKKYEMEYYAPPSNYQYAYPDQWNNYNFNSEYAKSGKKLFLHTEFLEEELKQKGTSNLDSGGELKDIMGKLKDTKHEDYFADRSVDEFNVISFSLSRIKYPTGGYTAYVYEPHKLGNNKGGGLRIQKIVSKFDDDTAPLISEFKYRNGTSNFDLDYKCFMSTSFSMSHNHLYELIFNGSLPPPESGLGTGAGDWFTPVYSHRTYSMNPVGDLSLSEYKIYYKNVDIYQYDENGEKYNGKKSLQFKLPTRPMTDFYEGVYFRSLGYYFAKEKGIANSFDGEKPVIDTVSYFDNSDNLIKLEAYEYEKIEEEVYEGLKAKKNVSSSGGEMPLYPEQPYYSTIYDSPQSDYYHVSSYVDYMSYKITTGSHLLTSKTTTTYTPTGNISYTESYDYNDQYQIKKISLKDNNSDIINTNDFRYPQDFAAGNNIYHQMVDKNMISPVIEKTYKQGVKGLKKLKTEYIVHSDMHLPGLTKVSFGDSESIEITYDKYDEKGNILQYTTKDGMSTTILWGYNYQYPVAEIRNATYDYLMNSMNPGEKNLLKTC